MKFELGGYYIYKDFNVVVKLVEIGASKILTPYKVLTRDGIRIPTNLSRLRFISDLDVLCVHDSPNMWIDNLTDNDKKDEKLMLSLRVMTLDEQRTYMPVSINFFPNNKKSINKAIKQLKKFKKALED